MEAFSKSHCIMIIFCLIFFVPIVNGMNYKTIKNVWIKNFKIELSKYKKAGKFERALLSKLFHNYDPTERPIYNDSENLEVTIGFAIQQIVELSEKHQTLSLSGWLDLVWLNWIIKLIITKNILT